MHKKKIAYMVLFLLLIIMNIFLVYSNIERHIYIKELMEVLFKLSYNTTEAEGQLPLPLAELDFSQKKLNLIVVFSDEGCESCIFEYATVLTKIYSENKDFISVFYTGQKEDFFAKYHLKIPYKKANSSVFQNNKIRTTQPFSILYDEKWNVILANVAEMGKPEAGEKYFKNVGYLLSLIK